MVGTIDQRNNLTSMKLHCIMPAGRLLQITQADSQIVKLALDAIYRLTAITTANETSVLSNINLTNGANLLRNPGVETAEPTATSGLPAQFWINFGLLQRSRQHTQPHRYLESAA